MAAYWRLLAEDGRLLDMSEPTPMSGPDAIAAGLHAYMSALSPLTFQSRAVSDDVETVVVEWTGTGVHSGELA